MSAELRFQEFVTSGAFTITLTRQQVAQLSMMAQGQDVYGASALFRKGLADEASRPDIAPDRTEFRITPAGLLVAQLCYRAGLCNAGENPLADEIVRLQSKLDELRVSTAKVREDAWSTWARFKDLEIEKEELKRRLAAAEAELGLLKIGVKLKPEYERERCEDMSANAEPIVRLRDKQPDVGNDELERRLSEDGAMPA